MEKVLGLYSYAQYTRRFSLHVFFCWFLSIKQPHSLILTLSYNNVISGNATDNILFRNFKSTFTLRILSQPIFQCCLQNGTQFHQSVIVAILYYSANLILTLSYLAKTPQLKYAYYSNAKQQAVTCGQILEHLTCNFIRTRGTCTSVRVSLLEKNYFTFQRNNCCALFIQLDLQHVFF